MDMELRQLEYFVAVAEEANFTRAAERVHISQSGVSAQIRRLENDLGATLVDRSRRRAGLTAARAALASADAVRQAVEDVNELIRGRLVVGTVSAGTVTALFDALAAFHRAHPGVDIALVEDNSDRLVERVRAGAIDLALVGTAGTPPADLDALTIVSEGLVAAVAIGHPLARRRRVTLADISAYPIVCLPEGTGIRTVFDRACAAQGVQADISLQASAPDAVADLATRGLGDAIHAESMATNYEGRLKALAIDDVDTPAVLALISTATKSPALRELLVHTDEAFTRPRREDSITAIGR